MATTCWGAGGHRDAHQSKMLWLPLCNGLKQGMTMTESNIVMSSMWHQQLGRHGVEVSVNTPVAWLFLSCPRVPKGELPVPHSPKPSAVNTSDDDDDRKPECSPKWLCNLLTWVCVVWKCGWASTRGCERVRAHANVCEWPEDVWQDSAHPCLQKLSAFVI